MFSSSELSSHQMAHPNLFRSRLPSCALIKSLIVSTLRVPLQLKGCTRTSTLFSPTTPSGASVLCAFSSRSALHFDFGVEQACSAAARVLLASPSRASPSSASSCTAFIFSMRRILTPRCAACGSTLLWIRFPFFWSYVFVPVLVQAREVPVQGRTDVLSRPRLPVSSSIVFDISSLLPGSSAESFCTRAAGRVFPVATAYNFQFTAE